MSYKTFTSQSGWFSLTLPVDWEEYEDEDTDEGTYAFFNTKTELSIVEDIIKSIKIN